MNILLDSNILLSVNEENHSNASTAVRILLNSKDRLIIAPQNLAEYYAGATRPVNPADGKPGKGLTPKIAHERIMEFRRTFILLPETIEALDIWIELLLKYQVRGRQTHDARLAAFCMANGIEKILTFDRKDFDRYSDIAVLHPGIVKNTQT